MEYLKKRWKIYKVKGGHILLLCSIFFIYAMLFNYFNPDTPTSPHELKFIICVSILLLGFNVFGFFGKRKLRLSEGVIHNFKINKSGRGARSFEITLEDGQAYTFGGDAHIRGDFIFSMMEPGLTIHFYHSMNIIFELHFGKADTADVNKYKASEQDTYAKPIGSEKAQKRRAYAVIILITVASFTYNIYSTYKDAQTPREPTQEEQVKAIIDEALTTAENAKSESSFMESRVSSQEATTQPINETALSLYIDIEGEKILLLDFDDPIVRSFYVGCDGYDVNSLDVIIKNDNTGEDIKGYVDSRYTWPLYTFTFHGMADDERMLVYEKMLNGASFMDYVKPAEKRGSRTWSGLVFDDKGFPLSVASWDNYGVMSWGPSTYDEMARFQSPVDGFIFYFTQFYISAFIMTDTIKAELNDRGFNLDKTSVIAGDFYSRNSFLFSDGDNEVLMCGGDTIDGKWREGDFITAQEHGKELLAN